jgi:hypothetical protein
MKKIVKLYILPLMLTLIFAAPAEAQMASNNYEQAQKQVSSEKKREKSRRKREKKAEKNSEQAMSNDAQHGWLFSKKRTKKSKGNESRN